MATKNIHPNQVLPNILISLLKVAIIPIVLAGGWIYYYNNYKKPEEAKMQSEKKKAYELCLEAADGDNKEVLGCNTKFADIAFPVDSSRKTQNNKAE